MKPLAINQMHPPAPSMQINKPFPTPHSKEALIFQAKYPKELDPLQKVPNRAGWTKKILIKGLIQIITRITGSLETVIVPAVHIFNKDREDFIFLKKKRFANPLHSCSSISFKTADGVLIDGMIQWNDPTDYKNHQENPFKHEHFKNRKWIIFFNPNAMCYEQLLLSNWAREYSQKSQCNILLFNYRGVIESQGYPKSIKNLILDADAAFQFLLDKGIASSSILTHGLSLGGGISVQVRALHPDGPIVNEKSFSSIAALIQGLASTFLPHSVSKLIGRIASSILKEAEWELNSLEKWSSIKGHKWIITGSKDQLMQGMGRLYNALKAQLDGYVKADKSNSENAHQITINEKLKAPLNHIWSKGSGHCDCLTPEAEEAHYAHLRTALNL